MKRKQSQPKGKATTRSILGSAKDEKTNPFDLHVNREKHSVLGRKLKHDRGKPGVSRSKANKSRLEFFQKAHQLTRKSNNFVDKRIGEYDDSILKEDAVIARFTQATRKKYKKNIYNLNEDEELTHSGQPVLSLEYTDKPHSDSDEDEEDAQLDADFVNKVHFGGFLTKKDESPKSHKEIIDNLIVESKRKKEEKKAERELNEDLTEKLNKEWKEMHLKMAGMRGKNDNLEQIPKREIYDVTVQELKFEPRATASHALKTEDQIKKEEEERLKELEKQRRMRMNPSDEKNKIHMSQEVSADSLYDGLDIDENLQQGEIQENATEDKETSQAQVALSEGEESANDVDEDSNGLPDIQSSMEDESASTENLLFTASVPHTVSDFSTLIKGCTADEVSSIVESIIKEHHVSIKAGNKTILEHFFSVMIRFLCEIYEDFSHLELLNVLIPHVYMLSQLSPVKTGMKFREVLLEKVLSYNEGNHCPSRFPSFDFCIILKLCSVLYSTSDFRHAVVTPCMLLMSDILSRSYKVTLYNVLSRLFISNLFYEYVAFSKRLATEPICFLRDVLFMSSSKEMLSGKYSPRHNTIVKKNNFLFLNSEVKEDPSPISLHVFNPQKAQENTSSLKVSVIFSAITQLSKFARLYVHEPAFLELFSSAVLLTECLPISLFPIKLVNAVEDLKTAIREGSVMRNYLTFPNRRPPMLKMLEPSFEMDICVKKKVTFAKKLRIEKQLSQKIKKEEKGVIREIRRDAQFLARQQLQERIAADEERKLKVKKLYHELSMQEGEYKKMTKRKK